MKKILVLLTTFFCICFISLCFSCAGGGENANGQNGEIAVW